MKTTLRLTIATLLLALSATAFALASSYGFRSIPDNARNNPYERAAYGNMERAQNPYQGIYDNREKKDGNNDNSNEGDDNTIGGRQNVRGRSDIRNGQTGLITPDQNTDGPLTDALPALALMALGYTFILIRRKK